MANTYSWQINNLDVYVSKDGLSNVVYNIHWTYIATSDQQDEEGNVYSADSIGVCDIALPDSNNFVEFDNLTKEQVESWIEASVDVEELKRRLNKIIEEKITPVTEAKSVPW